MSTSNRLRIRATKTLFEILILQNFDFRTINFVVAQGVANPQLIWDAATQLVQAKDSDVLDHDKLVKAWDEIFSRGIRVERVWDRPRRPGAEGKGDEYQREICMVTFFFDAIDEKIHNARMGALLNAYGANTFYRSIVISYTGEIKRPVADSMKAVLSSSVHVDIFTVADLAFNVTTHCYNGMEKKRLRATEIAAMSELEKNGPAINIENIFAKFYGLLPGDYLAVRTIEPIESNEKRGNLVQNDRWIFLRATA